MPVFNITKMDAARRQLETAATLYFDERDPVAIHTLAAAGYELAANLARHAGHHTIIETGLLGKLPPEIAKLVRNALRKPQNFFKHADKYDEEALAFEPQLSELILLDGMAKWSQLEGEVPILFEGFAKWFAIQHPEFFEYSPHYAWIQKLRQSFGDLDRTAFLRRYLAANPSVQRL